MVARLSPEAAAKMANEAIAKSKALVRRLRAGSTDLTAEGAAAFNRVDPETRVGLDAAMEAGWEPREALPAFKTRDNGEVKPQGDSLVPGFHRNLNSDEDQSAAYVRGLYLGIDTQTAKRARPSAASPFEYSAEAAALHEQARRTREAAQQNVDRREAAGMGLMEEQARTNPRVTNVNPHPDEQMAWGSSSWGLNENIPGLAAGTSAAAAAAYALAPREAQAAMSPNPAADPVRQDARAARIKEFENKANYIGKQLDAVPDAPKVESLRQVYDAPDKGSALMEYLRNNNVIVGEDSTVGDRLQTAWNWNPAGIAFNTAELIAHPIVRALQDNAGRPLVESYLKNVLPKIQAGREAVLKQARKIDPIHTPGPQTEADKAAEELMLRSASMLAAGPGVMEKAPERTKLLGVGRLEESLGETGTAFALGVGQQIGELPLYIIGPGKWAKLGEQATKGAARAGYHAMGGAQAGVLTALGMPERKESELAPGMTLVEGGVGGLLLGGAFASLAEGYKGVKGAVQGARIKSDYKKAMKAQAVEGLSFFKKKDAMRAPGGPPPGRVLGIVTPEAATQLHAEVIKFPGTPRKDVPKKIEGPVMLYRDPQLGLVAKVLEGLDSNGSPLISIIPLTEENASALRRKVDEVGGFIDSSRLTQELYGMGAEPKMAAIGNALLERSPSTQNAAPWHRAFDKAMGLPVVDAPFSKQKGTVNNRRPVDPVERPSPDGYEILANADGSGYALHPIYAGEALLPEEMPPVTQLTDVGRMLDGTRIEKGGTSLYPDLEGTKVGTAAGEFIAGGERTQVPLGGFHITQEVGGGAGPVMPRGFSPARRTVELPAPGAGDTRSSAALPKAGETRPSGVEAIQNTQDNLFQNTDPAQVKDLIKMGFDMNNVGAGGVGGGSYKGGNPDDIHIGMIGEPKDIIPEVPEMRPPEWTPQNYDAWQELSDIQRMVNAGLLPRDTTRDKVANFFLSQHLRGATTLAAFKTAYQSAAILQRGSEDVYRAARQRFGGKLMDKADQALDRFFKTGTREAWDTYAKENPEVTDEARRFAFEMFKEKKILDEKLIAMGYVPDDYMMLRDMGMLDEYVTRRYLQYVLPEGRWAKALKHKDQAWRVNNAIEYYFNQSQDAINKSWDSKSPNAISKRPLFKPGTDRSEIAGQVLDFVRGKAGDQNPLKSLKERQNLSKPERDLLGEIESGQANIAISLGTQRALVARLEALQGLHAQGNWSNTINDVAGHLYKLPESKAYGAMGGKWVGEDTYRAVVHMPKSAQFSHELLSGFAAFMKGNQVAAGGLGPLLNSTFGNLWSGTLAGGLDLYRPIKSGKYMYDSLRAVRDFWKDSSGRTGLGNLINEARRYGADYFGFSHEEIGSPQARKFVNELLKGIPDGSNPSLYTLMEKSMGTIWNMVRTGQEHLGVLLDVNDRIFRMQSYLSLREKFLADFAKNGAKSEIVMEGLLTHHPKLQLKADAIRAITNAYVDSAGQLRDVASNKLLQTPGAKSIIDAVAKLAARRVNQSFWNPTFISQPLDKLRKSAVGAITPYATAAFETMRVNGMLMDRLAKREKGLAMRLAGAGLVVGGAFGANGLMAQYNGIDNKQVRDALAQLPDESLRNRPMLQIGGKLLDRVPEQLKPFVTGSMMLAWRDDKGRIQFWDASKQFDPMRFLAGSPQDSWLARPLSNFALNITEGGLAEDPVRALLAAAKLAKPPPNYSMTFGWRGNSTGQSLMNFMYQNSLFPGAMRNIDEAVRKGTGATRLTEEGLTPGQAVLKGAGISNVVPSGRNAQYAMGKEYQREKRDFQAEANSIKHDTRMSIEERREKLRRLEEERRRFIGHMKEKRTGPQQ